MLYLFAFRLLQTPYFAVGEEQILVLFPDNEIQTPVIVSAEGDDDPSHKGAHSVESTFVK